MTARLLTLFVCLMAAFAPSPTHAEPADIDAAARGVVRIVIVGERDGEIVIVSHGTGFAVAPNRIVTNAHVVGDAREFAGLRIGVVPSQGDDGGFARLIDYSPRNDLALLELTGGLRLPPLTLAGPGAARGGEVVAVGYPMNVDRAQGLGIGDLLASQPPVAARGSLAGARPSRQFDTLLHTAPIARGNSGGPLLDPCGRVLGVNSFGAESGGSDAEFYFAVSLRELLPFLRRNEVAARVNEGPCRSLAEVEAAERERERMATQAEREADRERAEAAGRIEERARLEAQLEVAQARENAIAAALLGLLAGLGSLGGALWALKRGRVADARADALAAEATDDDLADELDPGVHAEERRALRWKAGAAAFGCAGVAALAGATFLFVTRPGLDAIDRATDARLAGQRVRAAEAASARTPLSAVAGPTNFVCALQPERSRDTGTPALEVTFEWTAQGCVNGRTQYGEGAGRWTRLFVPNAEDAVSVNRFDPQRRVYTVERYLLGRAAMAEAREARAAYTAPPCDADDAAIALGDRQGAVEALLPDRPNERLIYACEAASPPMITPGGARLHAASASPDSVMRCISRAWP